MNNNKLKEKVQKRIDSIRTLCNFMKNVSRDFNLDESTNGVEQLDHFKKMSTWYIKDYYRNAIGDREEEEPINPLHNLMLFHTLSLWQDIYSLCPLIHDFNMDVLQMADDETVILLLPEMLMSLRSTRDKKALENILSRTVKDFTSASRMFWILVVEVEREAVSSSKRGTQAHKNYSRENFFARLIYTFTKRLTETDNGPTHRSMLRQQGCLVEKLVRLCCTIRQSRCAPQEKKALLRKLIGNPEQDLLLFDPVAFPVLPELFVVGLIPDECSVFQSQLNPLLLTFMTKTGQKVSCIFKSGDDLRQDAVIIQLLNVFKKILETGGINVENMLTYKVQSTGMEHGFIQFIPSESLDNILQREQGLKSLLSNGDKLDEEKMKRFLESTAFYTVATYLLCIGDRHLDNILLTNDGCLFHIDYGFVGREPKPFAPAVKLCPEMIEIMGGKFSGYYASFLKKCISIYLILRRNIHVVTDMLELMVEANISDITEETIDKVRRRCHENLSETGVISVLTSDIESGFETIMPKMMDNFHHTWKVVQSSSILHRKKDSEDEEWLYV